GRTGTHSAHSGTDTRESPLYAEAPPSHAPPTGARAALSRAARERRPLAELDVRDVRDRLLVLPEALVHRGGDREILHREPRRVEDGDLVLVAPPGLFAEEHPAELGDPLAP